MSLGVLFSLGINTFLLNRIQGVRISDSLFLYVAFRKEIFAQLDMQSPGYEYCMEFPIKVHKAGLKYTEIPSYEKKRIAGQSKVNAVWVGLRTLYALLKY